MTRGRLAGYLRYRIGDYLLQRAALPLVMVVFLAFLPVYGALRRDPGAFQGPQGEVFARTLFTGAVALFLPIGVFLASAGVISTDRQQGHFRFYFSKPVGVLAYYAQVYLVHGALFVALYGAITWVYGAFTVPQSVAGAMAAAGLTFVLVGGLGFALGALTRIDMALVALVYVLASTVQQLVAATDRALASAGASASAMEIPGWVRLLANVLPPVHKMDQLRDQLYASRPLATDDLWHVVLYGFGLFAAGFLAVRRLPLAR